MQLTSTTDYANQNRMLSGSTKADDLYIRIISETKCSVQLYSQNNKKLKQAGIIEACEGIKWWISDCKTAREDIFKGCNNRVQNPP